MKDTNHWLNFRKTFPAEAKVLAIGVGTGYHHRDMRIFLPSITRLMRRLPEWRRNECSVANLFIGISIALLVYFVEQTSSLQRFLNLFIYLLLSMTGTLIKIRISLHKKTPASSY